MINRLGELQVAAGVASGQTTQKASGRRRSRLAALFGVSSASSRQSTSHAVSAEEPLQKFLARLDETRTGPVQELEACLLEVKALHKSALTQTKEQEEKRALAQVERCADEACRAAQEAKDALCQLAAEVEECANPTERRLRKQSFTGVSVLFHNALTTYYQAQQDFRGKMEDKVKRQLKMAFRDADDLAVDAVAAGQRSAGSAIQDALLSQSGTGSKLSINLAIKAMEDKCNQLEELATAAKDLHQRFVDVEIQVLQQGEIITNIAHHVDATRSRTEGVNRELRAAAATRSRWCWRWCTILSILVLLLVIGFVLLKTRTGKKPKQFYEKIEIWV